MRSLWRCAKVDDELVPRWLSERDTPWLRDLLLYARSAEGRSFAELEKGLSCLPPDPRAGDAYAPVRRLVLRLVRPRERRSAHLAAVRQHLFAKAARDGAEAAIAEARRALQLGDGAMARALFVDLPSQGVVAWPRELDVEHLRLLANRVQVQGLFGEAVSARLRVHGASRTVLRTAWLAGGGLAVVRAARDPLDDVVLDWTGGSGVSGRARRRALQALLPVLPWTRRYALEVRLEPGPEADDPTVLRLSSLDPLLPGPAPRPYDSGLERAFVRDLARLVPDAEVVREPVPLVVDARLAFPDFAIRLPGRNAWFVELAGLRDREAATAKLALLLAHERLLLCMPRRVAATLPAHPRIVTFARRVDAAEVLERLRALDECRSR